MQGPCYHLIHTYIFCMLLPIGFKTNMRVNKLNFFTYQVAILCCKSTHVFKSHGHPFSCASPLHPNGHFQLRVPGTTTGPGMASIPRRPRKTSWLRTVRLLKRVKVVMKQSECIQLNRLVVGRHKTGSKPLNCISGTSICQWD